MTWAAERNSWNGLRRTTGCGGTTNVCSINVTKRNIYLFQPSQSVSSHLGTKNAKLNAGKWQAGREGERQKVVGKKWMERNGKEQVSCEIGDVSQSETRTIWFILIKNLTLDSVKSKRSIMVETTSETSHLILLSYLYFFLYCFYIHYDVVLIPFFGIPLWI